MSIHWIIIALVPPFLWAMSNHIDKYLVTRYAAKNVYGLVIISALAGGVALPIIYFFTPEVFHLPLKNILALLVSGVGYVLATVFYLKALLLEDASKLVTVNNIIPVISYFLGIIFLGEYLSISQLVGGCIVLLGTFILTIHLNDVNKIEIRPRAILLMLLSTCLWSIYFFAFKKFSLQLDFWAAIFWQYAGFFIIGVILLGVRKYREPFVDMVRFGSRRILSLNYTNEGLNIAAVAIANMTYLLAPIALVSATIQAYQTIFAFLIGVILTIFFPYIAKEDISKRGLLIKIIAMLVIISGFLIFSLL